MKMIRPINNQRGQIAIEYVLLSVVMAAIFLSVRSYLVSNNTLASFVQKPWELVAGMIETGVWGEPEKARTTHPGLLQRHITYKGDTE